MCSFFPDYKYLDISAYCFLSLGTVVSKIILSVKLTKTIYTSKVPILLSQQIHKKKIEYKFLTNRAEISLILFGN